jgi:hypothetical protein
MRLFSYYTHIFTIFVILFCFFSFTNISVETKSVGLINIYETNDLTEMVEGESDMISISLINPPLPENQVTVTISNVEGLQVDNTNLVFNNNNWNIPQNITITALDNNIINSTNIIELSIQPNISTILNSQNLISPARNQPRGLVFVNVYDNDGVIFDMPSTPIIENQCVEIELSMETAPEIINGGTGDVTLTAIYDDTQFTVNPNTFTFPPSLLALTPRIITVCAIQDNIDETESEQIFDLNFEVFGFGTQYENYIPRARQVLLQENPLVEDPDINTPAIETTNQSNEIHALGLIRTGGIDY